MALRAWAVWALLILASNYWTPASGFTSPAPPSANRQRRATEGASYRRFHHLWRGEFRRDWLPGTPLRQTDCSGKLGRLCWEIARRGHGIEQVGIFAAANIVLLHAGTNDMKNNVDPPNTPARVKGLIDYIFKHSSDAVVLPGKAKIPPDSTSPENCKSTPSWYRVGEIATGARVFVSLLFPAQYGIRATSDDGFKPAWLKMGVGGEGACPRAQLQFMDLDGDGLKNYACVGPKNGATKVHLNLPDDDVKTSGFWNPLGTVTSGRTGRDGGGVLFADRLEKDGVGQWQELGKIAGGVGATNETLWEHLGIGEKYQPGEGVIVCDLDGDRVSDYFWVDHNVGWGYLNKGMGHAREQVLPFWADDLKAYRFAETADYCSKAYKQNLGGTDDNFQPNTITFCPKNWNSVKYSTLLDLPEVTEVEISIDALTVEGLTFLHEMFHFALENENTPDTAYLLT
ncbi:Fc.00g082520.m01.CDS01 [Cosmosporella sp. VM-42]